VVPLDVTGRRILYKGRPAVLEIITKEEMAKQGWKVLEYVPFGRSGAAYDARRLL
jgi:hypothetical protein